MTFYLDKRLHDEVNSRKKYLFKVFRLYFTDSFQKDNFLAYESIPKKTTDICLIVGHNDAVSLFLRDEEINENTIIIVSCDGGYKKYYRLSNKTVYLSHRNEYGLTLRRIGDNYGFGFNPSDSELDLYNCDLPDIYERLDYTFERVI